MVTLQKIPTIVLTDYYCANTVKKNARLKKKINTHSVQKEAPFAYICLFINLFWTYL